MVVVNCELVQLQYINNRFRAKFARNERIEALELNSGQGPSVRLSVYVRAIQDPSGRTVLTTFHF